MARILITVPTWNEATVIDANLRALVAACRAHLAEHDWMVEVADNGSTDATRDLVRRAAAELERVQLREVGERGKGGAIRASWQGSEPRDAYVFVDADLAADLRGLPALIGPVLSGEADLVCGSRLVPGSNVRRRWLREAVSRAYRRVQRALLNLPVQDAQCGFKAASLGVVALLPQLQERGFLFDTELLARAASSGLRIREIPVDWVEQRDPNRRSAVRPFASGWEFLRGVWRIRRRVRKKTYPLG